MSSDEKALKEAIKKSDELMEDARRAFDLEIFGILTNGCIKIVDTTEGKKIVGIATASEILSELILKTRQEAREEERKRIIGLPCMEEIEISGSYYEGKNDLRRELKEEINL